MVEADGFAKRRARLREKVAVEGGNAFLSTANPDIRFFTGCMDAGGWLVIDQSRVWLLTSAHDGPQAMVEGRGVEIETFAPGVNPLDSLARRLAGLGPIFADDLPASLLQQLHDRDITLRPGLTADLRRVKEPGELDIIRQAARIVEAGMTAAIAAIRPGVREIDVAAEAERAMRALGADGRVFESKVESGPRSAMPSTYASTRQIEAGELVLIDIGPTFRGYFGDLTRTFVVGAPSTAQLDLLELTLAAQANAIACINAGVAGGLIDAAARSTFRDAGMAGAFLHATGHTLGLAGDSALMLSPDCPDELRAGECVTVEPGLYIEGIGGVRIEDEILVTEAGCTVMTSFDKSIESLILSS